MPDTAVAPPPPLQGSRGARGGPVNMPLMRDPDHYEEINVIGNGNFHLKSIYQNFFFNFLAVLCK